MKKILFTLFVSVLIGHSVMAQQPSGVIYKTSVSPVIDGKIDNIWKTAVQYNIDKKFKTEVPTFGAIGTTYWKSLWDDKGMYILVVVNDDFWYPYIGFESPFAFDRVELYFDTNVVLKDGLGGQLGNTGHRQITPDSIIGHTDGIVRPFNVHDFLAYYAIKVTDPKWNVEFFIPWDCIPDKNGVKFDQSRTMGFDITLVDRDPGDTSWRRAQWANEGAKDENWNNMDDAGHLTFQEMVVIEGGNTKTLISGESTQLSAKANFPNPGTLTYLWSPSEGLSQTNIPNPIVTVGKDITYTLTVTNSDGNIGKATVSVKVNPFIATVSNQTVSCGNTVQLDVSTNYTGTGILTYNWQPADKLDNSTSKSPVATITQATDFTVVVTTPNGSVAQKNVHVDVSKLTFQPQLCLVSVDSSNYNVLVWEKPGGTAIKDYLIFRESLIQTDFYDLIGSVASTSETVYTDLSSNALVQSNKYKIAARDNCGFVTSQSIPHKTMHLTINKGQGNAWNLIWEPYDGFVVSSYKIYRGSSSDQLALIGSTAGSANSYTDLTAPAGDVYYQVEVMAPFSCNSLKSADYSSTRSNMATNSNVFASTPLTKDAFSIFPVPVNDILYLNKDINCISEMVIISVDGRIEMSFKQPIMEKSFNVSSLPRGMHLLKIADNDGISTQKFIKE